ncbi:hypothetical protein M409DRAFT_26860 [Zasmidium cellare ATCC 36951]|uniref:NAD-dependent epimerase/dehydratase domain-containing protein n=1 Tax=Zasmidium cellare ATCC 36951 TaxID=1080233 RepID=A0A6A6C8N7_ZASCE|nr:uncharacterized protein M409DRAFT_26860 [Zasmidium cellare ATCC 36951]KAF2162618.1 hypothetical protein M409DRAFT_26860 [Zasmidium cellare ATCC 36951]
MGQYTTLSKGSTMLITGVNGLVGSHCADQALQHGYKVRGTTRSLDKNKWLLEVFGNKYGTAVFELVEVKDMQQPGAFDEAMQGCSAVMHTASVITFEPDPDKVIHPTLKGVREILRAASKTPSVRRVVYTSSQAALCTTTEKVLTVTQNTWNDTAVTLVTDPAQFAAVPDNAKGLITYCASKVLAEKACWEFVRQEKRHFTLNSVVPNFNTGPSIYPTQPASSSGYVKAAFLGDEKALGLLNMLGPMNYIDVRDDGRLHLAAAVFDDVHDERIWGMAGDWNVHDMMEVFEEVDSNWKDVKRPEGNARDQTIYDRSRSVELLKRLGCDGFTSFEQSVRANLSGMSV